MLIFNEEKDLADLLSLNTTVASTDASFLSKEKRLVKAKLEPSKTRESLYPVYSLLVSSSWNENDDVFAPEDLMAARHTPINHPTNIEHNELNIVGHITDSWAVDGEMNLITGESLPDMVHLIIESVIYTHFRDEEKQAEINELIMAVENYEKFVSMELFFNNFDYAIEKENQYAVITRNESSAFLTKYLRAYGGSGIYQGYRIGRQLRDFYFIGKGYVNNPANKPSKILPKESLPFAYAFCNLEKNKLIKHDNKNIGVQLDIENMEKIMPVELEKQMAQVDQKTPEQSQLEATIAGLEAQVSALNSEKEAKAALVAELEAKVTELTQANEQSAAKISELESSLQSVTAEKTQLEDQNKTIARCSDLVGAGLSKESASKAVSQYFALNDEQWKGVSELLVKANVTEPVSTPVITTTVEPEGHSLAFNITSADQDRNQRLSQLQSGVATLLKEKK